MRLDLFDCSCLFFGANENKKERILTARGAQPFSLSVGTIRVCTVRGRRHQIFIAFHCFASSFCDSHGIDEERPTRFDRCLSALQFSSDIWPRIAAYLACESFLIGERERERARRESRQDGEKEREAEKKNVQTAIHLSRVLIYRGVV